MTSSLSDADQRAHNHPSLVNSTPRIDPPQPSSASVSASRPPWRSDAPFVLTEPKQPEWQFGDGANDGGESLGTEHVEIDPYEPGRPSRFNYKLLISGIVPRPIGFLSTRSADGTSTNLAPFSYTSVINHDPPLFTIGFSGGFAHAKDTLRNLAATRECTINIISEHFLEAANSTAINSPYGVSEWAFSGLRPAPCAVVSCSRVREAVFSIEATLVETREFESRANPGTKSGVMAIVEGVRFWVREDALNAERSVIDIGVLRPMARLGGIMYSRVGEGVELPRPEFEEAMEGGAGEMRRKKVEGQ